jgi:hypothetical protein
VLSLSNMEGFVHSDTHINFAIHGEDRESGMNIEGGEVEAQEIGAVNDGGKRVQSGAPAFGIGAVNDEGQRVQSGAHAFGIGAGNEEQMPALAAAPGFPIGAFNDRVWPEPNDQYIFDDGEAPGFGIGAGYGVDWQPDEEYIIDDGGAPGFGIEAGNDVDWQRHTVWPVQAEPMHGVWPVQAGPMHGAWPMQIGGGQVLAGPMNGVWPMQLGGGPVLAGPINGVWPMQLGGPIYLAGPMHLGGLVHLGPQELGIPNLPHPFPFIPHDFEDGEIPEFTIEINEEAMHGVPEEEAGPVYLGPQEHGIPNLPHLFPDDFEEGEIPDDFEEGEIPDFTIGINEEAVNGVPEILERVCESVEIDELAVEQGEDCAICLEALNHVEDDNNENGNVNRILHRLPCSHLFHSHCILEWFHRNLTCPTCRTPLRLQ